MTPPSEKWRRYAACDGMATTYDAIVDLGYGASGSDLARAYETCEGCPVRWTCLVSAVERREGHGMWGGMLASDLPGLAAARQGAGLDAARVRPGLEIEDLAELDASLGRKSGPAKRLAVRRELVRLITAKVEAGGSARAVLLERGIPYGRWGVWQKAVQRADGAATHAEELAVAS